MRPIDGLCVFFHKYTFYIYVYWNISDIGGPWMAYVVIVQNILLTFQFIETYIVLN